MVRAVINSNSFLKPVMKKKISIALLLLSLVGLAAFAQEKSKEEINYKYQSKDWGVSFNVSGLIDNISLESMEDINGNPAIRVRKFIDDRWAISAGFGLNSFNIENSRVDSVGAAENQFDSTYKRTDFFFAPGVEYHFKGTNRLDPYAGLGVTIGTVGSEDIEVNDQMIDTTGTASFQRTYKNPGGFTFGANLTVGFNYFIAKRLSLGAEYQWGFIASRTGGDYEVVTINDPISGASTTTRTTGSDRVTNNGFRMRSTMGVTLSYFFNLERGK